MKKLEAHPLADILPLVEGREYENLRDDIHTYGLALPIMLYEGKILDGRNRYRACCEIGIEPEMVEFRGDDPAAYVFSLNLARRHLNESQRAMCAAKLETLKHGRPVKDANLHLFVSRDKAAGLLNVSERLAAHARVVCDSELPDLIKLVEQGHMAVSAAASVVKEGAEFVANVVRRVLGGMKPTEALRQARKDALPAKIAALPNGIYRVIYADPPWQYNDARRTGDHRESTGVLAHYADMSLDELKALDVKAIAAKDSVLLCWAVCPLLQEGLDLVKAWGFTYKTIFIWDKEHGAFGHYHDADAEVLILATRGSCTPEADKKEKQIQRFPRERHSAKPEGWRALIDRLYLVHAPVRDRIELFRRGDVPEHWDIWGAEADDGEAAA